jgi:hypothetical protein
MTVTTVDQDNASRVAGRHLDTLTEFQDLWDEFSSANRDELIDIIDTEDEDEDRRKLAQRAVELLDEDGWDELGWDLFTSSALDIEVTGTLVEHGWEVSSVALLVSFGGPTVRYVADDDESIRIEVSWWADRDVRTIDSSLASFLWEIGTDRAVAVAS